MKTSEFVRKVEELGYEVVNYDGCMGIYRCHNLVAAVYENVVNKIDTDLNEGVPDLLFDALVEYARTPIKDRKDYKKYYLYNRGRSAYFNYCLLSKTYYWLDPNQKRNIQTQFTEEEIKNHKFRDIMELLVKEEV